MVGRMDGQSVVLKAEKRKTKPERGRQEEITGDIEKGANGGAGETGTQADAVNGVGSHGLGEGPGGACWRYGRSG